MINIALTGGIGSGKTAVAKRLASHGAEIIAWDELGHQVLHSDELAFNSVVDNFGSKILDQDGQIDRVALGKIVFSDPQKMEKLNKLTHPYIRTIAFSRVQEIAKKSRDEDGKPVIVVHEIPLIVENPDLVNEFSGVICVWAPFNQRVDRLIATRGLTEDEVIRRMALQADDDERMAAALWIVKNNGSLADLDRQVDHLWPALVELKPFVEQTPWFVD